MAAGRTPTRAMWLPCGFAFILTVGATVIHGHHSAAGYDPQREVSITGVVTNYEWANPHIYIHVRSANDVWEVEAGSPGVMRTRGWSTNTFVRGEPVTVTVHPPRDSARRTVQLVSIRKADGTILGMGAVSSVTNALGSVRRVV